MIKHRQNTNNISEYNNIITTFIKQKNNMKLEKKLKL